MKTKIIKMGAGLMISCLASQVFAAGFQIQEQNVTNLGLAYSGTAALAEDASTGFYNAAGLTRLGESEVVLSAIVIEGNFDFTASNALPSLPSSILFSQTFPTGLRIFSSVPGENTDDPGTTALVPAFYISKRLDDRWVVGFNVSSPFGLHSKYKENGIARYLATDSSLQTFNFSPSIAYQVLTCLSAGFGVDAMYAKAILDTRIGNGDAVRDGFQKNRAEGWGYGFHAGVLWSPTYSTRFGLSYRSMITLHAEGNSEILTPSSVVSILPVGISVSLFDAPGIYTLRTVRSEITLPETWTFSLYQELKPCLAWTADVAWTNWSRFHTLRLRFAPGATSSLLGGQAFTSGLDSDTWEHFKDARRYALGLIYKVSDCWLFRIGGSYDETPVRNDFRTARLPDSDRIWAAIGGAYTFSPALRLDFGYAHLFFKDALINEHAPFIAGSDQPISGATLQGSYDSNANIVGIQMRYDFV